MIIVPYLMASVRKIRQENADKKRIQQILDSKLMNWEITVGVMKHVACGERVIRCIHWTGNCDQRLTKKLGY